MTRLRVAKFHATGNDFLVLDARALAARPGAGAAARLCDRHRGVGADGLLLLGPGRDGADCSMVLHNADGGVAEMSGNGIRCLAAVACYAGLGRGDRLVVDTAAGRRTVDVTRDGRGAVVAAEVDMGPVAFDPAAIPVRAPSPFDLEATVDGAGYRGDAAGMGNPHLVLLVDDPDAVPVTAHGPLLERDERFPRGTNVEFVAVAGPGALRLRVWERGVGETLSCGTGACAAAAVAHRRGLTGERVEVHVPGGALTVTVGETVRLGGPVVHVFDADVDPVLLEDARG